MQDLIVKLEGRSKHLPANPTIGELITKYTPENENDTEAAIRQTEDALGVDRNTRMSEVNLDDLLEAIIARESPNSYKELYGGQNSTQRPNSTTKQTKSTSFFKN